MNLIAIAAATNLTDWIIGTFGWGFMQPLWDVFDALFNFLNFLVPCPDMWTDVWERLFC